MKFDLHHTYLYLPPHAIIRPSTPVVSKEIHASIKNLPFVDDLHIS